MITLRHLLSLATSSLLLVACGDPAVPDDPDGGVAPDAAVEPAGLAVAASLDRLPILQGTAATVTVTVTRADGLTGPVAITATDLPPGVTADALTIAADATSGTLTLRADATAAHSLPTAVSIVASLGGEEAEAALTVTVYGPPGSLDTSFGGGRVRIPMGNGDDYASALVVQPDGKLILGGRASEHLGDFALVRLDRDGTLDETFGTGGRVLTDFGGRADAIHGLALQPDGKIVAVGTTSVVATGNDFAVARYDANGSLDTTFGTGGKVITAVGADSDTAYAVLIRADGRIIVGGDSSRDPSVTGVDFALAGYTATGQLDAAFGADGITLTPIASSGGRDSIYAMAFQPLDGEARFVAVGGEGDFTIARYRWNGVLDTSFGDGGTVSHPFGSTIGAARAVTITPTGQIAVAGHSHHDFALLQLEMHGDVDLLFGTDGMVVTPVSATNWDEAHAIAVDTAGKLVVAGWAYDGNSSAGNFVVTRHLTDGTLDPGFGTGGVVITPVAEGTRADEGRALVIQEDPRVPTHRIVTAGSANVTNSDFAVARYWR